MLELAVLSHKSALQGISSGAVLLPSIVRHARRIHRQRASQFIQEAKWNGHHTTCAKWHDHCAGKLNDDTLTGTVQTAQTDVSHGAKQTIGLLSGHPVRSTVQSDARRGAGQLSEEMLVRTMALSDSELRAVAVAEINLAKQATSKSNAELHREVAELRTQVADFGALCAELTAQVKDLKGVLKLRSSKNLLEFQAEKGEGRPSRENFTPTLDMVGDQVNHVCQWNDDTLAQLAISGDVFAQRERVLREIMRVNGCSWDKAHDTLVEIDKFNEQRYWMITMPYRVGIVGAACGAVASILLVFHGSSAQAYAENVAGEQLPDQVKDVSDMTTNQVGTWTWNWMEPMIGVASFVLLCLQFARAQSVKMNAHPYTEAMLRWRANRLAKQYPQYDGSMLRVWSRHLPVVNWNLMPMYRRQMFTAENRKRNFRGEYAV